ncbi:MAG TPA: alpha/beta fold hydrolase [Rhizomicrobium sp.]
MGKGAVSRMTEKRVVFLLPGLLCDAAIWRSQVRMLSGSGDVRVPHFFGYDSIPAMARAVLSMAPERFSLAGHSMGGRVAIEIVHQAPERVERLALLDTGVHAVRPAEAEARQELVELAFSQGMEALAARWIPPMIAPERAEDATLVEEITAMVCRATPLIFTRQIRALLARPPAMPVLPGIACPVQVIVGRQDGWSPVAQHEEIVAAVPGAKISVIEDCGHMAPLEQPKAVGDILAAWLQS